MFDQHTKLDVQVKHLSQQAYGAIRKISHLRQFLNRKSTKKLVHAFLSFRLDYCNSMLFGIPDNMFNHIQRFQNTAARIVTKSKKYDHFMPILSSLHWLPVKQRLLYKILITTYKMHDMWSHWINLKSLHSHMGDDPSVLQRPLSGIPARLLLGTLIPIQSSSQDSKHFSEWHPTWTMKKPINWSTKP